MDQVKIDIRGTEIEETFINKDLVSIEDLINKILELESDIEDLKDEIESKEWKIQEQQEYMQERW